MVHSCTNDQKNRLTNLGVNNSTGPIESYAYTLDNAGHRTSVTELSGRAVSYAYDTIYRLTSETIASDPSGNNGAVNYTYDAVGNRTQMNSTLAAVPAGAFSYDADDRLVLDTYDANGNTINSGGVANTYDFENHLIGQGGATIVYDGDGNRVKKTVGGVTTTYLVADENPTGYAQVVSETISGPGTNRDTRSHAYGLERISQTRNFFNGQNFTQTSFYVYDGHGSVRALTDPNGNVTDTYDYDAFGNLIHSATTQCATSTGTITTVTLGAACPAGSTSAPTANEFLFAGEQYDFDLHLYYNRARYLNTSTGRFWTMDAFDGDMQSPLSLHKYLYGADDPVTETDPTGYDFDIASTLTAAAIGVTLEAIGFLALKYFIDRPAYQVIYQKVTRDPYVGHFKEFEIQINSPNAGIRFTVVQWLRGSYTINGRPTYLYHQNDPAFPFDFPNWAIDSFSNLAEYPGVLGATSLKKEQNDVLFYDAPGAHVTRSALPPGTYEANLDFQINVYEGSVSNDVSWFRSIDDPTPVLRINWDFHDVFQVAYP